MGEFMHDVEGEMMCTSTNEKIPYFNAPIYLENKTPVGKVDEILGPITQVYFTIKPSEGIQAKSFKKGDKFFIGGDKLLPLDKYVSTYFASLLYSLCFAHRLTMLWLDDLSLGYEAMDGHPIHPSVNRCKADMLPQQIFA